MKKTLLATTLLIAIAIGTNASHAFCWRNLNPANWGTCPKCEKVCKKETTCKPKCKKEKCDPCKKQTCKPKCDPCEKKTEQCNPCEKKAEQCNPCKKAVTPCDPCGKPMPNCDACDKLQDATER